MKARKLLLAVLLAAGVSCYPTTLMTHAGKGGEFQSTAEIRSEQVIVQGVRGRLYVDGIDYGRISEGDQIEVDSGGNVYVNGVSRFR